ncbi:MAG TPA: 6-phosphogluconolactonase [Phycisphaerales bacterium]|nr:MAG: hypothetical protein A2Y13_07040 [Planctomycetes bacterium GWC2_45_44]HBG77994.1 6-phosphogluconolactonase [Phycisphaerales bacterium]HBR19881.1 6-phosphogluconolactonase [Phycisphaerales bacterium]
MSDSVKKPSALNCRRFLVYIAASADAAGGGIYVCHFNAESGELTAPKLAIEAVKIHFIALHPNGRFLYAVSGCDSSKSEKSGCVCAFSIETGTGHLTFLNRVSSGGDVPCHITIDQNGRCVFVANYGTGTVSAFPIQADGHIANAAVIIQHTGSSVDTARQNRPHPHSITLDADNRFALVADLGLDQLLIYRVNPSSGTLTPNCPPCVSLRPGSGPRHIAFHPDGRYVYAINELANTVTAFDYDSAGAVLCEIQTITTIPKDYKGETYTSEIEVHPSGKYLYGSNRGHNSIAVFEIDKNKGTLTMVDIQPCGGKWPRHFGIDPTGKWMLIGNEQSDLLSLFGIDSKSGKLTQTGISISVPSPVCIRFMPICGMGI